MRRFSSLMIVLLLAAGAIFAQGFGQFPMGGNNDTGSQMVNTDKGLFALRNGVLAKYDIKTLQQVKIFSLFGAEPVRPTDMTNREALMQYMTEIMRRQAPALMVAKDNYLLIVIGNGLAKIDQDTLTLAAPPVDITTPSDPTDVEAAAGVQRNAVEPAPKYVIVDNTIYLFRTKEIIAVSLTDGAILTRTPLAKELRPSQQMNNMFGNRGGQGGFGGRGGQGGQGGQGGRGGRGGQGGGDNAGGAAPNPPANN